MSAHGHIAALQAETILRELAEARGEHAVRALVLRACAALYDAAAGAERADARTEERIAQARAEGPIDPEDA